MNFIKMDFFTIFSKRDSLQSGTDWFKSTKIMIVLVAVQLDFGSKAIDKFEGFYLYFWPSFYFIKLEDL